MTAPVDRPLEAHPWSRFVAVGDSVTEGYGMDPVKGVEQLPWAARIAHALDDGRPGFAFHNLGYRNLRAAQIREAQLDRAVALEPDLVAVAAGPNDLLFEDFGVEQLWRDLAPLYAGLAETGATMFTFSYMDLPGTGLLPADGAAWLRDRMVTLHAVVAELAQRHDVVYVDLFAEPESADPAFFSADLQHANAAGQAYVAERTLSALGRRLERDRAPRDAST